MPPQGDLFSATQRPWWDHLSVSAAQKLRARHDFSIIDHLNLLIEEVERVLARLSVSEPWAEMVPFLIQLPGFGLLVTMTVLGAIGNISRFPSDKLVSTCPVPLVLRPKDSARCWKGRTAGQFWVYCKLNPNTEHAWMGR